VKRPAGNSLPRACPTFATPAPPSTDQRRAARDLASRAQEAVIVSDTATARALYERAMQLDPTDANTAYALARAYQAGHDPRAIAEYCRSLALAPSDGEASDARQRIAALSLSLPAPALPRETVAARGSAVSPGAAFALGLVFPGLGQYSTGQPAFGLLVTAAAAGALYYGLHPQTVSVTVMKTGSVPYGPNYTYPVTELRSGRPNLGAGVAAAAGIALIGAIEAYAHARGMASPARPVQAPAQATAATSAAASERTTGDPITLAPAVIPGLGLGVAIRLALR